MSKLTVMLIRHAEKPGGGYPGPGLTLAGTENDKSLVVRGWQRAGAWAAQFVLGPALDYPRPNVIYAAAPEPISKKADYSHRPHETSLAVADRMNLTVQTKWGAGQEKDLVADILRLTGVVLVFWEHKTICKAIIPGLRGDRPLPGVPSGIGDRFDVVLRFDRASPSMPWSFRQLSPCLLKGDTEKPFAKREP